MKTKSTMLKIAVLITCFNRRDKTITCLTSLFSAKLPDNYELEVFLVDDGSTDGTKKAVMKNFPLVNIFQGNGNLYWNRGMHMAWEMAIERDVFDFFIWLNDDVELFEDAFLTILESSLKHKDSIISGVMRTKKNDIPTYGGRDKVGNKILPNGKDKECYMFNGNFVLIPKYVFDIVGNLDYQFPHAIGDYDYAMRAKKSGIKFFITPYFSGNCDANKQLPDWCLPQINLTKRFASLYSPLGYSHPYYFFVYENRHFGILVAIKHFLSIHLRVLFPSLWITDQ